jgi:hypothetical protein
LSLIFRSFQFLLEVVEKAQTSFLELANPALVDLVKRDRVDEMPLLAPAADRANEIGLLQKIEMLGHGLAFHVHGFAKLAERLTVLLAKTVEQHPSVRIGQGLENLVVIHQHLHTRCVYLCRYTVWRLGYGSALHGPLHVPDRRAALKFPRRR